MLAADILIQLPIKVNNFFTFNYFKEMIYDAEHIWKVYIDKLVG